MICIVVAAADAAVVAIIIVLFIYPPSTHQQENAVFVEVIHLGWPYVFIATISDINEGEEV